MDRVAGFGGVIYFKSHHPPSKTPKAALDKNNSETSNYLQIKEHNSNWQGMASPYLPWTAMPSLGLCRRQILSYIIDVTVGVYS